MSLVKQLRPLTWHYSNKEVGCDHRDHTLEQSRKRTGISQDGETGRENPSLPWSGRYPHLVILILRLYQLMC